MAFVHLHNHTEYSLLDGQTNIVDMVRRAADLDMPAVAITDHGVMSGVPELCAAVETIEKETGKHVEPIYGCEIYFTDDEELKHDPKSKRFHMILIAKNNTGYHNLLKLVSVSHVDNFYRRPRTPYSLLQKYSEGLIGTSACVAGIIPYYLQQNDRDSAVEWAKKLSECFEPGDFYIELQDQGYVTDSGMTQHDLNMQLDSIAKEWGFKTIATNDMHYLLQEDAYTQDLMLCIGTNAQVSDTNRMKFSNDQFYMKTEEEMRKALADFPEACDNTVELASKCHVVLEREAILPLFPLPEGHTDESYFRFKCEEGLKKRYGDPVPKEAWERYEYEAGIIIQQGFPAYFLIVQEYIEWARNNGIGVGPGRGSAAGAIVAYAMGITDLDPLENGLMFERFLSPERVEMPDIDVDFDDERREEVVDHVREVYGEDHVAKVITFGKMKAKNAVRDAARVLSYDYGTGDAITKLIGDDLGVTIDSALEENIDLKNKYDEDTSTKDIIDAARRLEGRVRNEGVHACATIICRDPMSDHVPLKLATGKNKIVITQYDGDYTPGLGLLKMDFLGLRTLGVLTRACGNVEKRYGKKIVPEDIPIDDEEAFNLIRSGNMDGLFQVESALYLRLFSQIPPKKFSDIVVSIALNRTGPLESGMVEDYIKVVQGKTKPDYYDDRLRPVLEETYGSIVYQEQIMQISMVMCGFSAGKADKLRKAMGKKKLKIMLALKEDWCDGAVKNGYSIELANRIWDDVEKFAKYAFNKSHSAAYAILVMRTAYMKAHYPNEFMAAVLSSYMNKNDRLIKYIASANFNGTPVLPPDINQSVSEFTAVDNGIRFGLVGLRGVGGDVADRIVAEREKNGPFKHIYDFVLRLDSKCCNRRVLEALVKGGAFDSTGYPRKQMMEAIDSGSLTAFSNTRKKDASNGQFSLFDLVEDGQNNDLGIESEIPVATDDEWDTMEMLHNEKSIMNMYVTDHPVRPYMPQISSKTRHNISQLHELTHDIPNGTFGGMISEVIVKRTKRGKLMATFNLEDTTGNVECICFNYDQFKDLIAEDKIVLVKGKFERGDRGNQVIAYELILLHLDAAAKNLKKPMSRKSDEEAQALNSSKTANLVPENHSKIDNTQNLSNSAYVHNHELPQQNIQEKKPISKVLMISIDENNIEADTLHNLTCVLRKFPGSDKVQIKICRKDAQNIIADMPATVSSSSSDLLSEISTSVQSHVEIK